MKDSLQPGLTVEFKFKVPENKTVPYLYPEFSEGQVMPKVLATGMCCAALALCGCATQFAAEPPDGVSLAGHWKIDHGAGDDPQKLLAQMRAQAAKIISRQQAAAAAAAGAPPSRPSGMRARQVQFVASPLAPPLAPPLASPLG